MMTKDYYARVEAIAADVVACMRERMSRAGDYRPLYVYVSPADGGHVVGHEGQHAGYWRTPTPVATAGTEYARVFHALETSLTRAPLYAGGAL